MLRSSSVAPTKYERVDTKESDKETKKSFTPADKAQNLETMSRLLQMAQPERHLMILSALTMAFSSSVSLAVPKFSGKIIDISIHQDDENDGDDDPSAFRLLMMLLGIMTISGVAGFFRILWQAQAGHRMVARLRRKLYVGILSQDAEYFDSTKQGDIISRLSSDADLVQSAVTDQILGLLRNMVMSMGAVAMLFHTSISLALISVAILPPIAICARFVGRRMRDRQKRVRELHASATSLAEQAITCIRTVQQFVAESHEAQQYHQAVNEAHAEGINNAKLRALFGSTMQLILNLAVLCVLGYGGKLVQNGELTPGDLAGFVMYSVMMGANVSGISSQYIDLMKAIAAATRVFEVIDREPAIPSTKLDIVDNETLENILPVGNKDGIFKQDGIEMMEQGNTEKRQGRKNQEMVPMSVDFRDVSFAYPTRKESLVLNGLNLSIGPGQVLALVGGSGAGKSTITSLLTRLYDPQDGSISIDGQSLTQMEPREIRQSVGIVVQEPLLFPTTIEANIRYGSPHATDEEVREAARLAYVLEFADKFPDGLQTVVGPRGTQLSGGQKQRVAVARCILKNPPIVIFDEATSALDAVSEAEVQKAIDIACEGRTVILVAHRLSTIRNAGAIAVLQNGKVAEFGSFDTLMKTDGAFRQLMEKQLVQ
jgi:ATP-binding cassette subfamily B protein